MSKVNDIFQVDYLPEKKEIRINLTVEFKDAIDTIEALQQENEWLNAALDKVADMIGECRCPTDFNSRKCSDFENCLHCWKDWLLGGKEDV